MDKVHMDSLIGDALVMNKETARFFEEEGMHCDGCPAAMGESIAQACAIHGVSAQELVGRINEFLSR